MQKAKNFTHKKVNKFQWKFEFLKCQEEMQHKIPLKVMKSELPIPLLISKHPKSHFSERLSENLMIMMYTYSE